MTIDQPDRCAFSIRSEFVNITARLAKNALIHMELRG
jgi:hypothetical protein